MLKIGEFARLSQVSLKTLRHYDTLGLLRPSRIDPESGYRFYDVEQLADMVRIQALKDCGFALDQIAHLLQTHDLAAIGELLRQRVAAQQQVVADEQARLQRLIARAQQLASSEQLPLYHVALRRGEALTLVGRRGVVVMQAEIGPFAMAVLEQLEQQAIIPVGPLVHLYTVDDSSDGEGEMDLFVGAPVVALPAELQGLVCERLPHGEQVACVVHRGEYTTIKSAYIALNLWLATSGYRRTGPCREIYHRSPLHTVDPASYVTEIQYPIEEAHQ